MKKRYLSLISLLPLTLASCSSKIEFPYTDDTDLVYLCRNGDNLAKEADKVTDLVRLNKKGEIVERIQNGESVMVYCFSYSCAGCIATEKAMSTLLKDSHLYMYGLYNEDSSSTNVTSGLDLIKSSFPELKEAIGTVYYTPTVYLIRNKTTATKINIDDTRDEASKLENQFKSLLNFTNIYEFNTYAGFAKMKSEQGGLFILDKQSDTSFYHRYVYQNAIHSKANTFRIDMANYSEDDRVQLNSYLGNGETTLIGMIMNGKVEYLYNYEKEPEKALGLVNSYYQVQEELPTSSSSLESQESSEEILSKVDGN